MFCVILRRNHSIKSIVGPFKEKSTADELKKQVEEMNIGYEPKVHALDSLHSMYQILNGK